MAKQTNALPQLTREEMTPPPIQPVPAGVKRPRWSVMIPTYNCARFLRETIESVLSQDIDPADMQIEVIDDCSTTDDPEAVVREYGQGRVSFYKQPKNVGATGNFNTCIKKSKGEFVHILHGDDYILPGFYAEMQVLARSSKDAGLLASRIFYCDEAGIYYHITGRFKALSPSPKEAIELLSDFNPFQFAGVVVRRSCLEALGGFIPALNHTADWEMWTRIAGSYQLLCTNKVLGVYRNFLGSDSSKLTWTAENLRDHARFEQIASSQGNAIDFMRLQQMITNKALQQARSFEARGVREAATNSYKFWRSRVPLARRALIESKHNLKQIVARVRRVFPLG